MTEKTKRIIQTIAAQQGVTPEYVEEEMMKAIRAAMASPDPHAQALWKQICPDGKTWTPSFPLWQNGLEWLWICRSPGRKERNTFLDSHKSVNFLENNYVNFCKPLKIQHFCAII